MLSLRRTKIIATLGPASADPITLKELIAAGTNVVRINMSHGVAKNYIDVIRSVRDIAIQLNKEVGILIDLQGPKLRIGRFTTGTITLEEGEKFCLDTEYPLDEGNAEIVGVAYKDLSKDLKANDNVLLDDGRIVLTVISINDSKINCIVKVGGVLSNNKGLNREGGGLSACAITEKDKEDIVFAAKQEADFVAISFPRSSKDILHTKAMLSEAGSDAAVIAKIERVEAIACLNEIIKASDAVMIARGDLGVEIGFAQLPGIQKRIIAKARSFDRAVITATQMMESMISSPIPTRAEVSDVANSVLEGSDAVMLSAETATGAYPVEAVKAMVEICIAAEKQSDIKKEYQRSESKFKRIDEAIAMASMYTANHLGVAAIIALTESGSTTLWMSRISSDIPIYGVSRIAKARGRMTLYRGVYPIDFDIMDYERWEVVRAVITNLRSAGKVKPGDKVIITRGDVTGVVGLTNSMKIVEVEPE